MGNKIVFTFLQLVFVAIGLGLVGLMALSEWTGKMTSLAIGFGGILLLLAVSIVLEAKVEKPVKRSKGIA